MEGHARLRGRPPWTPKRLVARGKTTRRRGRSSALRLAAVLLTVRFSGTFLFLGAPIVARFQ